MGKFNQLIGVTSPPIMKPTSLIQLFLETDQGVILFADLFKIFNKLVKTLFHLVNSLCTFAFSHGPNKLKFMCIAKAIILFFYADPSSSFSIT